MTDALDALCDPAARVLFFPVRHHSPVCSLELRALCREVRPGAILIEGPSDFNDRLDELYLGHRLPIAIYSYVCHGDHARSQARRGAYYPFCIYSPEWQALLAARELGAFASFIDLPWGRIARLDQEEASHRYADGRIRRSPYVEHLCRKLGVDGFDALWDTLFELDPELDPWGYLERGHHFSLHARLLDEDASDVDLAREAFMARRVREAMERTGDRIVVVTGGFHAAALHARVHGLPLPEPQRVDPSEPPGRADEEGGIALTPYAYEQLDSLAGYEAGMPNPGFYHQVWLDREQGLPFHHQRLMGEVVTALRRRGQRASSADLIAVETMGRGLAALRGHHVVWRTDLIDGVTGALVKDEVEQGVPHPMLGAIHEVFRGGERGQLAAGTRLPPLVHDLYEQLEAHDLAPTQIPREVELELGDAWAPGSTSPSGVAVPLAQSRLLHRLRFLGLAGIEWCEGSDMARREDLARVWERWRLVWTPDLEVTAIQAAIYGPSISLASVQRLLEQTTRDLNAEQAGRLLLEAALMGQLPQEGSLAAHLRQVIRSDGDFFSVALALDHLLYLFQYDAVLGAAGHAGVGSLLAEAYGRALWLLEGLGRPAGRDRELLEGIALLLETFRRCGEALGLQRQELVSLLFRICQDGTQLEVALGAATGALFRLGEMAGELVLAEMRRLVRPDQLGDFLAGLFGLAREEVQRQEMLVHSLDEMLVAFSEEAFLEALPALRMAFTYFTPREKHHLVLTLLQSTEARPLPELEVSTSAAARVLAFEAALQRAIQRYGLGAS